MPYPWQTSSRDHDAYWNPSRKCYRLHKTLRHRLQGRGFQSKTVFMTWKPHRKRQGFKEFTRKPIQPLNPTVYVKAISFSGLCASSIGARFDQTRIRSSPRPNPESSFDFSLRYSAGAYRRKSQHFKTSFPVSLRYGSRFIVKYTKAAKAKLNHRSKLWLCSKALHSVRNLPYLLREPANFR